MATDSYKITIKNDLLDLSKTLTAKSKSELNEKIKRQKEIWHKKEESLKKQSMIEKELLNTKEKTAYALKNIAIYNNILNEIIGKNYKLNLNNELRSFDFEPFNFVIPTNLIEEKAKLESKLSNLSSSSLLNNIMKKIRNDKNSELVIIDTKLKSVNEKINAEKIKQFENYKKYISQSKNEIDTHNEKINTLKTGYESLTRAHVKNYFNKVLKNIKFNFKYKPSYNISYDEKLKTIKINFKLPTIREIPHVLEYKYVKSSGKITERTMSNKNLKEFYLRVISQITLGIIYSIFNSDYANAIKSIDLSGYVVINSKIIYSPKDSSEPLSSFIFDMKLKDNFYDSDFHDSIKKIIISLSTSKNEFISLDLSTFDFKDILKKLNCTISKDISYSSYINKSSFISVPKDTNLKNSIVEKKNSKIYNIDLEGSKENIKSQGLIPRATEKVNLATIPWESFEDLIGDLFSKEFSEDSSTVKVTKRSRDGGADVIIVDSDPIRGGKYIVQVKRYNRTVSPTAIRDLYGTIQHEGAIKGILVTTSDFGKNSLEFIKNKPLTLINGNTLLTLLKNHGYENYDIILKK